MCVKLPVANVSVCLYPLVLLPGVYRYGYAMPFYNVQQTIRSLVFGTRNQSACAFLADRLEKNLTRRTYTVGLNFGVQIAWIVLSWCTLVLFQLFMRRRAAREHKAEIAAACAESL